MATWIDLDIVPAPIAPPEEWFSPPEGGIPTDRRLTIEEDGRVYGYIARFDQCHAGLPGCVKPPRSTSNYERAYGDGRLLTAQGTEISVAVIAGGEGHAPVNMETALVPKYYESMGKQLMWVRYGEDETGIWFAGSLIPDVDEVTVAKIRASSLSGDWRWHAAWRETREGHDFMGSCLVNIPGYSMQGNQGYGRSMAIAASATEFTDNVNYVTFVEGIGFQLAEPRLNQTINASGDTRMACTGDPSNCGDCSGTCGEAKTPEALIEEMRGLVAKHDEIVAAAAAQADPVNALVEKIENLSAAVEGLVAQRLVDEITADFE